MSTENTAASQAREPDQAAMIGRRRFLARLSLALGSFSAAIVAAPVIGFLLSPLLKEAPETWRSVGAVDNFRIGETVEVSFIDTSPLPWAGVVSKTAAWLRRQNESEFIAFAVNCTHLGCPVRWLPEAGLFMCPCHGGVYYQDGKVAAGPPPKPLPQYPVQVRDGQVEIRTGPTPIT